MSRQKRHVAEEDFSFDGKLALVLEERYEGNPMGALSTYISDDRITVGTTGKEMVIKSGIGQIEADSWDQSFQTVVQSLEIMNASPRQMLYRADDKDDWHSRDDGAQAVPQ
eukprot:gnl/MRDRNA2_/MRDRNA2_167850_c0_seq1.p1 gnl/MRDRNA2_/MRDRNA2_167850_c0~~gnl/MRDRNA2_/MRDRNA2_167850_c0_seq1.p1  ORF type:complete len:111 (+),score=23.37 gnl/MRDRNA2_/MRDRNA2_167850_c0_seq1:341-673(+)